MVWPEGLVEVRPIRRRLYRRISRNLAIVTDTLIIVIVEGCCQPNGAGPRVRRCSRRLCVRKKLLPFLVYRRRRRGVEAPRRSTQDDASAAVSRHVGPRNARLRGRTAAWLVGLIPVVAGVQHSLFPAYEQPAETAANGLDEVPRVECVEETFQTQKPAVVAGFAGVPFWIRVGFQLGQGVRPPWEAPHMHNREDRHLYAYKHVWDANLQVLCLDDITWLYRAGRGEEGDHSLGPC